MNKLFNLSNIDWNNCEEYACSNLLKMVCEYKRNNPSITIKEMQNIIKLGRNTIQYWWKKGTELGLWRMGIVCSHSGDLARQITAQTDSRHDQKSDGRH
jgi:hypothetical protein